MSDSFIGFLKGFGYAAKGIAHCVKTQRNMRFHICAAVTVIFISRFYRLDMGEYALLAVIIAAVMAAEAVNTAVESAVDLVTAEKKPLAAAAKDCAAGAVLITAVGAAAAGIFLFGDIGVLGEIAEWFAAVPTRIAAGIVYIFICIYFIFGIKRS